MFTSLYTATYAFDFYKRRHKYFFVFYWYTTELHISSCVYRYSSLHKRINALDRLVLPKHPTLVALGSSPSGR